MRRMYSEKQIKRMIAESSDEVVEALNDSNEDLEIFENIVDKDGHKRFVEGKLRVSETEGFEFTYAKWSLSGSHLIIVLAGNIANGTAYTAKTLAYADLPKWIDDKITPTFGSSIGVMEVKLYNADTSSQAFSCFYQKGTQDGVPYVGLYCTSVTASKDRSFRIQIDLLIDNE